MQRFAIMSPTMGLREDYPAILLQNAFTSESENTAIRYGEIWRTKGRLKEFTDSGLNKVRTPDTFPILRYHRLVKRGTGTEYIFAFTKAHIYQWNTATKSFDLRFTNSSNCEDWDTVTFNDKVIATNNIDLVQVADGSGNFAALDTVNGIEFASGQYMTTAKVVIAFENYLFFGYLTDGGTVFPQRIRWCKLGDETIWDTGDAGVAEVGKRDFIVAFGKYQGFLIIFKEDSYYKLWLVPGSEVFNMSALSVEIGCGSKDSIINDATGQLYFFASDFTIRNIQGMVISGAIDKTMKLIQPALISKIRGLHSLKYNEMWWAIPYGNTATENNKIIIFSDNKWSSANVAISAFGEHARQEVYQWDNLPFESWDTWGWDSWDATESNIGFLIELAADYSGYTYALNQHELDDTSVYTGFAVFNTDLSQKQILDTYKRLLLLQVYIKRETTGSLDIHIKQDNEATWQLAGSVGMSSVKSEEIVIRDIPCDFRAKSFQVKISANTRFRFVGIIFKYVIVGQR